MTELPAFLENDLAPQLPLDGEWDFQLASHQPQRMVVPAAWEAHAADKLTDGPAHYRRRFSLPADWLDGRRIVFEAGAVSYAATVSVNGRRAGLHTGMWAPFQLDVTSLVRPGENEIHIEVWKPGGRYPLRETLSGFLPDVATAFGGLWQSVSLRAIDVGFAELRILAQPAGQLLVEGQAAGTAGLEARVEVLGPEGQTAMSAAVRAEPSFRVEMGTRGLDRWTPARPRLNKVVATLWREGRCVARAERRVGLRTVGVAGHVATLDGQPLHLRGVLDWGWDPGSIRPARSREALRRQFEQIRALGFNLVKLCLFVPDETTFVAADEAGVLLWLEMPMWLPRVTPGLRALALREYAEVFRRVHHHPSIVVVSLGCELNAEADADLLRSLNALAREWFPNVLHCDNSGSAEAYGGVQTTLSDIYDYHFYTDPHFFDALVGHFDRGYQARKPWLYGEFCDAETGRDFSRLQPAPWWLTDRVALDRDVFIFARQHRERLRAAGIDDGGAALTRRGRQQATAICKHILERARLHDATGGYVISGWSDTPITTAGIVDDYGELKFAPEEWQPFNADAVLLLDRERRRRWVNGGDRPAYRDPYTWRTGERAEMHLLLSNGLGDHADGRLRWRLMDGERLVADGEKTTGLLRGAAVSELTTVSPRMPEEAHGATAPRPIDLRLEAELELQSRMVRNAWMLWAVPPARLPPVLAVAGTLAQRLDLAVVDRTARVVAAETARPGAGPRVPLLASELSEQLLDWVRAGSQAVVWLTQPDRRVTRGLPFWREAIHTFEPNRLWARVPHAGHADLRFYSVASDFALDLAGVQALLGPEGRCRPVWRRFHTLALTWVEYVLDVEYGLGRMLLTSLRLEGGLGRQPAGLEANPWGGWLLASLLDQLRPEGGRGP